MHKRNHFRGISLTGTVSATSSRLCPSWFCWMSSSIQITIFDRVNSEEYARMSWCLGDVIDIHGEIGPGRRYYRDDVYSGIGNGDEVIIGEQEVALPNGNQNVQGTFDFNQHSSEAFVEPTQPPGTIAPIPDTQMMPSEAYPPSTTVTPPIPELPEVPQARRPSSVLKSSQSVSIFPFSREGLWTKRSEPTSNAQASKSSSNSKETIQRVNYDQDELNAIRTLGGRPADEYSSSENPINDSKSTQPSVFRFDEVPGD